MYLNRKSLLLCLITLSYFGLMVVGRTYETGGGLMRDDYEYALEGIAVDYVTNRPKSENSSRLQVQA
uniref:Secreted protein n=1 Tax=Elaeophora elaphi TaxID=1147741 RepID=A0A0R3S5G5_9BILA